MADATTRSTSGVPYGSGVTASVGPLSVSRCPSGSRSRCSDAVEADHANTPRQHQSNRRARPLRRLPRRASCRRQRRRPSPDSTISFLESSARYVPSFPSRICKKSPTGNRAPDATISLGDSTPAELLALAHFLGYVGIDRVVAVSSDTKGADVAVGFATEGGKSGTAAVHLIRYGSSETPFGGSRDGRHHLHTRFADLSARRIRSPVRVGAHISSVDESITAGSNSSMRTAHSVDGLRRAVELNSPMARDGVVRPPTDPVPSSAPRPVVTSGPSNDSRSPPSGTADRTARREDVEDAADVRR